MALYEWNNSYLLGVKEIDHQHRELVGLINEIYDEFKGGATVPFLKSLLEVLVEHTTYHFDCEEYWMKETSYPGLEDHETEHRRFRTRMAEVNRLFEQGVDISLDLMLLLNNWVRHHLMETDAKFSDYIITSSGTAATMLELPLHLIVKKYLYS